MTTNIETITQYLDIDLESVTLPAQVVDLINTSPVDINGRVHTMRDALTSFTNLTGAINLLTDDSDYRCKILIDDTDENTLYLFLSLWRDAIGRQLADNIPDDTLDSIN